MTLAEVGEIFGYWAENPPPYLLLQRIARMLGWAPATVAEEPSAEEIIANSPPGLAVVRDAGPGMPAPVLDPVLLRERNRAHALALARRNAANPLPHCGRGALAGLSNGGPAA